MRRRLAWCRRVSAFNKYVFRLIATNHGIQFVLLAMFCLLLHFHADWPPVSGLMQNLFIATRSSFVVGGDGEGDAVVDAIVSKFSIADLLPEPFI